ncbi:MAG: hypothetical protein IKY61_03380, partial [Thermoguttaceae bacterium]|nr:hypothetical protein [Thermoguttaceae bacterium]
AFTGNKFEFRACGSSQSCAPFNTYLNASVAESLDYISERLEPFTGDSEKFDVELQRLLAELIKTHKRVIYNGNNYSEAWVKEAERRGLPHLRTSLEALRPLLDAKNHQLLEKYGVFSAIELESRYEIFTEEYVRKIQIEGEVARDMAQNMILPVVLSEYGKMAQSLQAAQNAGLTAGLAGLKRSTETLGALLDELQERIAALAAFASADVENCQRYIEATKALRSTVDALELVVDDDKWPLPKYREMLFVY